MSELDTQIRPPVQSRSLPNPVGMFKYHRYRTIEERVYLALFWCGFLFLILWIEVCIGIAVWRIFVKT